MELSHAADRRLLALTPLMALAILSACRALGPQGDAPPAAMLEERERIDLAIADVDQAQPATARHSPGCDATSVEHPTARSHTRALVHNGIERSARVYLPSSYTPGQALPVVFVLHGGFGSGEQIETNSAEFNPIAEREGFLVIYPDGVASDGLLRARTWNGGGCCGYAAEANIDDVGFLMALLDELEDELCIDSARVYSTGMSNGAIMSYRLACEASERIAAIAPVAAPQFMEPCEPAASVGLLHVHGTHDPNAPYEGGEGCGFANVDFPATMEGIELWRGANACSGEPVELLALGDGRCQTMGSCARPVVRCLIEGGGHSWPGGYPPALNLRRCEAGSHSTTFLASEVIWRFFKGQSR